MSLKGVSSTVLHSYNHHKKVFALEDQHKYLDDINIHAY